MKKSAIRPKWWLLYLCISLVFGLCWVERKALIAKISDPWIQVGLIFVMYGLVMVWLNVNRNALIQEEWEHYTQVSSWRTNDAEQNRPNIVDVQKNKSQLDLQNFNRESRAFPAWLGSLLAIITAFFKVQE